MSEWIEHDGAGMPVPKGTPVEVQHRDGTTSRGPAGTVGPWHLNHVYGNCWEWGTRANRFDDIIRYRIRRPRAMEVIDRILADVPEREPA